MLRRLVLPLIALLAFLGSVEGAPVSEAIAPLINNNTAVVIRLDLTKIAVMKSARRLLGPFVEKGPITEDLRRPVSWTEALRKAGATEVYVLFDTTPEAKPPTVVIPFAAGVDREALLRASGGGAPNNPANQWVSEVVFDKAVFLGVPESLKRARDADPKATLPPRFVEAMKGEGASEIQLFFAMPAAMRRIIEEQNPTFPPALGGGPVTTLTRGLTWASIGLQLEPKASLHVSAKASDPAAARALDQLATSTLKLLAPDAPNVLKVFGPDSPPVPGLTKLVEQIKVETEGDRLAAGLDLDPVADQIRPLLAQIGQQAQRRVGCINHLKQIMLAIHNYHDAQNAFPPAYKADQAGKPLLSWRVLILPYLGEKELYDQFHLDEPWHSPHNKALIEKMPAVYRCSELDPETSPVGKTSYLAPRGQKTISTGATGVTIGNVTDGTSNTIAVVDAGADNLVFWTAPRDWEIDGVVLKPETILKQHNGGSGSYVGFADGSVRLLKATINRAVLDALLTRNGGEVISADSF